MGVGERVNTTGNFPFAVQEIKPKISVGYVWTRHPHLKEMTLLSSTPGREETWQKGVKPVSLGNTCRRPGLTWSCRSEPCLPSTTLDSQHVSTTGSPVTTKERSTSWLQMCVFTLRQSQRALFSGWSQQPTWMCFLFQEIKTYCSSVRTISVLGAGLM